MTTRKFDIIGESSSANATIMVDNNIVFTGPISGSKLFTFTTDVTLHVKVKIEVKVHDGSIKIKKCLVTYPARINGLISGFVQFDQPIKNPMTTQFNGNTIALEDVTVTDYFCYDHLMFNGPTVWNIQTTNEVDMVPGITIKLKNTDATGSTLVTSIVPDWGYEHRQIDVLSVEEIDKFKKELYESK